MGNQFNSFKHQLSMGFNIIFAVLATFGMSYYIAGQMGNNSSKVRSIILVLLLWSTRWELFYIEYDLWTHIFNVSINFGDGIIHHESDAD